MLRITGGFSRNILLKCPDSKYIRPTTDFLRESVFSYLGELVENSVFLDLFAGTGSYGLESMSRGSKFGVFVEKNKMIAKYLTNNLSSVAKSCKKNESCFTVCTENAWDFFKSNCDDQTENLEIKEIQKNNTIIKNNGLFDLIFIDPPFDEFNEIFKINQLLTDASKHLNSKIFSRIILEMPGEIDHPEIQNLRCIRRLGKLKKRKPSAAIYRLN